MTQPASPLPPFFPQSSRVFRRPVAPMCTVGRSETPAGVPAPENTSSFSKPPTVANDLQQRGLSAAQNLGLLYWTFCDQPPLAKKLRISIVQYLNPAPL